MNKSGRKEKKTEKIKPASPLAEKVLFLFESCPDPRTGKKYSYNEVEHLTGGEIKNSWLSKVARGVVNHTRLEALTRLTDFFDVDAGFWFQPLDEGIKSRVKFEKGPVALQRLILQAGQLPEKDQLFLLEMAESLLRRQEGLKNKIRKEGS